MSETPAERASAGPDFGPDSRSGQVEPPEGTAASEAAAEDADAAPEPSPLGLEPDVTGNAEVDSVLQRLSDADELPTQDHVEVYEDVHGSLRDVLASLDEQHQRAPAPQPPATAWNRS